MSLPSTNIDPDLMTDEEYAAQLQQQYDDEDMLTNQLNSTFNFTSHNPQNTPNSNANAEKDEEMARKLQRKFYLDMKKQGFSDMDLASMLDTVGEENELEAALRASVGAPAQSYIEKYIVTLYNNLKYDINATVTMNDEFQEFRLQVVQSLVFMSQERVIEPTDMAEYIAENFVFKAETWQEMEAGYFMLIPLIPNISPWMHLHTSNLSESWMDKLYQKALQLNGSENPVLVLTVIRFMNISKRFVFMRTEECAIFAEWYLTLPFKEVYQDEIASALSVLCSSAVNRLFPFFERIFPLIETVESSKREAEAIEDNIHNLLKACTCVINDQPESTLVSHLQILFMKSVDVLTMLINNKDIGVGNNYSSASWKTSAKCPILWLKRLNVIISSLGPWNCQRAYTKDLMNSYNSAEPWQSLYQQTAATICRTLIVYADDVTVVQECVNTIGFMVKEYYKTSDNILKMLAEQLEFGFLTNGSLEFLTVIKEAVFKFGMSLQGVAESFGNLIDNVLYSVYSNSQPPQQSPEAIPAYKEIFLMVNKYCHHRINTFVSLGIFDATFSLAMQCLEHTITDLFFEAHEFIMIVLTYLNPNLYIRDKDTMSKIMKTMEVCGMQLTRICCKNAFTAIEPEITGCGTSMLQALKAVNESKIAQWVKEYLDDNHHGTVPHTQRSRFVEEFIQCNDKDAISSLLKDFSTHFKL
ncbi:unnamed protein product [Bursaphelenchus okinawaensis]|uniref:Importin N-terminal domain-containing protein n=1 Tax=Bursaphelenchus okinawaensis TaxID=465554 RepID=A0A811K633_9BILA|nr:unnamed protein product [Bursaphelenchus okinawaensis]CAG9092163.1 unnamed protein product [Bursaphelenchus okinawaensis]